jgi:hypothetical protein
MGMSSISYPQCSSASWGWYSIILSPASSKKILTTQEPGVVSGFVVDKDMHTPGRQQYELTDPTGVHCAWLAVEVQITSGDAQEQACAVHLSLALLAPFCGRGNTSALVWSEPHHFV